MSDKEKFTALINRIIKANSAVYNDPYLLTTDSKNSIIFTKTGTGSFYYYYHVDDSDCFKELMTDLSRYNNPFKELLEGIEWLT